MSELTNANMYKRICQYKPTLYNQESKEIRPQKVFSSNLLTYTHKCILNGIKYFNLF